MLSVGVETDMSGRLLDYGNVIVRTYVGKILFSHVAHPYEAAHLVEEQWTRTKRTASRTEKESHAQRAAAEDGAHRPDTLEEPDAAAEPEQMVAPSFYRRSILKVIGSNWFKLRVEDSGTITYRKHWFVLWQQVWQPTVLVLLIGLGMIARLITLARHARSRGCSTRPRRLPIDTMMLTLPILLIPVVAVVDLPIHRLAQRHLSGHARIRSWISTRSRSAARAAAPRLWRIS